MKKEIEEDILKLYENVSHVLLCVANHDKRITLLEKRSGGKRRCKK